MIEFWGSASLNGSKGAGLRRVQPARLYHYAQLLEQKGEKKLLPLYQVLVLRKERGKGKGGREPIKEVWSYKPAREAITESSVFVNLTAAADFDDVDYDFAIADFTDEAPVTDAILPKPFQLVALQCFADAARVGVGFEARLDEFLDAALNRLVEPQETLSPRRS